MTRCWIDIHNIPQKVKRYTVVRISEGGFYFFGTYDTEAEAQERARKVFNGYVIRTIRKEIENDKSRNY